MWSLTKLAHFCVVLFLVSMMVNSVCSAKKCSRTLRRIPVHKNFDLKRFSGTWYSLRRTTFAYGKKTFKSYSMEVAENDDGSYRMSYTGQQGDTCAPVQTGQLVAQAGRPGQYVLKTAAKGDLPTMIISFTDYRRMAMVYFCFKYRSGSTKQCHKTGNQVEILSRDLEPGDGNVTSYVTRAGKRLCVKPNMLKSTTPGLCQIPDILAAAKKRELDLKEKDSRSSAEDVCAVNNIPTQSGFNATSLSGLWYEIARTRFTFNKMESVVNYHRYDVLTNQIYSYYTGTWTGPTSDGGGEAVCMTAIQGMSKTLEGATYDSDRLGRIGWDDSTYTWSPTKVLYADNDYILFYACYSGVSDDKCPHEYMEVTLSGRSRDITPEKKQEIYKILSTICVNPDDMTDTKFLANCSEWVTIEPEEINPEDCKLDDIKVYDDYVSNQMTGVWYLYASITYNNVTAQDGIVMEKTLAQNEGIETRTVGIMPDNVCGSFFTRSRDMCYDTADQITTLPLNGNFIFSKVLYLDNDILVEYVCAARTPEGTCNRDGIQFNVYTKNDTFTQDYTLPEETQDVVNQLAKSVCLEPTDLELQIEWCNVTDLEVQPDDPDYVDCDLDQIEVFGDMGGYVQNEIYGIWYQVARSSDNSWNALNNVVAYFTAPSNETLHIYWTGYNESEYKKDSHTCADISHGSLITRCQADIIGDFLYRVEGPESLISYVPFKILYTDGTNMLVTYLCTRMLPNGQCSDVGTEVSIWSRTEQLDEEHMSYAEEMILWKCPEPSMFKTPGSSQCTPGLEDYIKENRLDQTNDDEDNDFDEESNANTDDNQGDQGLSDIERELLMDDHEFYYG